MNRIIFVVINNSVPESNATILSERVKALGKNFVLDDRHVFVETTLSTSEVHEKIIGADLQESSVIEIEIRDTKLGIWGRAKAGLWDWLDNPK